MNLINNWIKNNDENETLHLSYLNLSELPILPQNLKKLICSYNKISNLNNLPQNLIYLNCSFNKLINLNNLPPNLKYLDFSNNLLKHIELPNKLFELNISENYITNITY